MKVDALKSSIKDNYARGTVGEFLKEKLRNKSELSVVSAYFTIYAFDALRSQLNSIKSLDFLFGEPKFVKSIDPNKIASKSFIINEAGLKLANKLQQKAIAKVCSDWIKSKVSIRSVKQSNLLHGKMYHISNNGVDEAIIGSSNFTLRGLGLSPQGNNIELNLVVDSKRDREDLKNWFDELWNNEDLVEDVKQEVLLYLEQLYQNQPPEFVYFKTLFHIFEEFLHDQDAGALIDQNIKIVDTQIWKALYEFQKDGVKGAINKILKYNGCVIADSVGLGKTFEALAIIKYFELRNERVLVLCPKRLRENWTIYQAQNNSPLNPFLKDRFSYTVLSHTDLSRDAGKSGDIDLSTINWGNYNLVVIDESHHFRNNQKGKRDEDGNIIRKSRYEKLMDDIIKSGVKTKVLLLSATPVNNNLKDLRNQLYFLTEDMDDAFIDSMKISSLKETIRTAQLQFSVWAKNDTSKRKTKGLLEKLSSSFFKLLDELTIARSREHIKKYYKSSMGQIGGFPERSAPISIFPDIDLKQTFMSYDQLNDEISKYELSLFNPSKYIREEHRNKYPAKEAKFTQEQREFHLIGMMKVNFLKRLESSVHSFAITLNRTIEKINELEVKIKKFKEIDLEELTLADEDEDIQAFLEVGEKLTYKLEHLRIDDWLTDLEKDKKQLTKLCQLANEIIPERDAKLAKLKEIIAKKVQNPTKDKTGRPNRKILLFTAFADTAVYLYDNLHKWASKELAIHSALVTGGSAENRATFGKSDFNSILTNFSPVSKRRSEIKSMPQDDELNLLIATDCISEGQNLQDCDYLINYDIHWNPVRIIQRFGRIDRIGTINDTVHLVNFWPTQDLNKYINLKNRVEARMALVDITATSEENILQEELELIQDELKYRDKQLLRLKDEILDLEDFTESVTLNEFTLDDFRIELSKYIENNRKKLDEAPLGLYAVVPVHQEFQVISPGIIYCLKQKGATDGTEKVNPLQPYFLVYAHDDGTIRYTFTHPKQILEIFRVLCVEKTAPYEDLCSLFDKETNNGENMFKYSVLLEKAVASIESTFRKKALSSLQSGRSAVLIDESKQVSQTDDFELIAWLIIR